MNSKIKIMGVLNITDNSFYDGGKFIELSKSITHVKQIINDGADIIDIGAESSKPGSDPVTSVDQIKKIEPLVEAVREISDIPISIDTRSSKVIKKLLKYNINIVNDISSLEDFELIDIIKDNNLSVSLMHMQGTPKVMQNNPTYNNVVEDIFTYLKSKAELCLSHGIHNYIILNNLKKFSNLGFNILSGISRKSMIGDILNVPPSDRLYGTIAASVIAIKNQTNILRVHDVRETSILLNFRDLIKNS